MPDASAIEFASVSKVYQLYGSQVDQLISVLGLQRLGLRPRTQPTSFVALNNISLSVPRGHRLGVIGRNGAGKTTLLKLICGNVSPTSGTVRVHGSVQALMTAGTGFHPEHTGRENILGSLQYNGLRKEEYQDAIDGVVEFCELGEFIDQPFKTYSLGMQARLMFATATAIRPDILIVDEVLGAGDAYFVAKSRMRVEKLIQSGCTMLLVSHSMQQVLELCDEAIWLDAGEIRMQGPSFDVVKAYEEYIHGPIKGLSSSGGLVTPRGPFSSGDSGTDTQTPQLPEEVVGESAPGVVSRTGVLLQEPPFLPHASAPLNVGSVHQRARGFDCLAPGGLSRWDSERGLKAIGFEIVSNSCAPNALVSLRPAAFVLRLVAEASAHFRCRYGIALHDLHGRCITRLFSPVDEFDIVEGDSRVVQIHLNPCQIGPGDYTLGISILQYAPIERLNSTTRYDLLSRSFAIKVELPESLSGIESQFFHTAEWMFAPDPGEWHVAQ